MNANDLLEPVNNIFDFIKEFTVPALLFIVPLLVLNYFKKRIWCIPVFVGFLTTGFFKYINIYSSNKTDSDYSLSFWQILVICLFMLVAVYIINKFIRR